MKHAFKLFGIIALAALIVFSMVACPDGSGGGGGYNPDDGGGGSAGTLTITGIPRPSGSDNGWSVSVYPVGTPLSTWDELTYAVWEIDFEAFCGSTNSTGPTFRLWMGDGSGRTWTGSGSRPVLLLDSGYNSTGFFSATVNFSNGSATVPWRSFRSVEPD
jgi:hypothetical protein